MGEKYEKMIEWLKSSNRWKHLAGGFLLGGIAEDWYMASVLGTGACLDKET